MEIVTILLLLLLLVTGVYGRGFGAGVSGTGPRRHWLVRAGDAAGGPGGLGGPRSAALHSVAQVPYTTHTYIHTYIHTLFVLSTAHFSINNNCIAVCTAHREDLEALLQGINAAAMALLRLDPDMRLTALQE